MIKVMIQYNDNDSNDSNLMGSSFNVDECDTGNKYIHVNFRGEISKNLLCRMIA